MRRNTIVFHPCKYVSIYKPVNCYTITSLPLIGHVARCFTHIDGVFFVLSLFLHPEVLQF